MSSETTLAGPTSADFQRELRAALPGKVAFPGEARYRKECKRYWSKTLRLMRPAIIALPMSVEDVSAVMKILNEHREVKFAIRSGGHDPNPGNASINGGLLISLTDMKGATYDKQSRLAHVKPGGMWNDVISDLEPHGVTVVGGRLGHVGVGGYLLQGGLSFLAAQYGLAADSIVEWQVVLADGSIVSVDATTQPELAAAMRGSGSQFGIVTLFKIRTYKIGLIWGGMRIYSKSKRNALHAALHKFAPYEDKDPKAAIISTEVVYGAGKRGFLLMYFFYDGAEPPKDGPLRELLGIPCMTDSCKTQTYPQLLHNNGKNDRIPYHHYFSSVTLPYIHNRPEMYGEISDKVYEVVAKYPIGLTLLRQVALVLQPFPKIVGQASKERGGNAMGLNSTCPDRVIFELTCSNLSRKDSAVMVKIRAEVLDWVETRIPFWLKEAGMDENMYLPRFMNDAGREQRVTSTYRDYDQLKKLQEAVDTTDQGNAVYTS